MGHTHFKAGPDALRNILQKRVNDYFREKGVKRTGNTSLYFKSTLMVVLMLVPFITTWLFPFGIYMTLLLATITGLGVAGVGMNIMHDANHGVYHHKAWVNKLVGELMFIIAAHPFNWKNQHNVDHHTHTNIEGADGDIESGGLFRFTKEQKWKWIHRFQLIYALPLYSMTTFMRVFLWDFTRMHKHFREHPNIPVSKKRREWAKLISLRVVYLFFWIGVPIIFGVSEWYFAIVFFLVMHWVSGLFLTIVFQTAHVVPLAQTFGAEDEKSSESVHQLLTTCNFATESKFASWFLGGLNFQKEHHLFTGVSHVHYPDISKRLRDVCREFNVPYKEYRTFWRAVLAHIEVLLVRSRKPA